MTEPLHTKYRPQHLDDVVGQDPIVKSLAQLIKSKRMPHAFLLTGPSGCGKTTLARIIASNLDAGLYELDAARYSGIDNVRTIIDTAQFVGMGASPNKAVVVDECHSLSRQAWQTLLLTVEAPPPHLYWFFCTTEPDKVPQTIRTRCHAYDVKPVKWDLLSEYLTYVAQEEKIKTRPELIDIAARKSNGSVRQALVYLSMLDGVTDKASALQLVEDHEAQEEGPITLARMIVNGKNFTWPAARKVLEQLADVAPETIRLTVLSYATNVLAKEDGPGQAAKLMAVVQAFSTPCNPSERMAPIFLAVGSLLFGE